jgi:hypothetical protein
MTSDSGMTLQACATFCAPWKYMGVEYGVECWCGAHISTTAAGAAGTDCYMPCGGNSTQTCGGPRRLSMYSNRQQVGPVEPWEIADRFGNSGFVNCYIETAQNQGTPRTLAAASYASDNMSLQLCQDFCITRGTQLVGAPFAYWGVEFGRECYCGSAVTSGATAVDRDQCEQLLCSGNSTQVCGGHDRIAVYQYLGSGSS